jgi:hypothetical protein
MTDLQYVRQLLEQSDSKQQVILEVLLNVFLNQYMESLSTVEQCLGFQLIKLQRVRVLVSSGQDFASLFNVDG